ncbi:aminomethyltransferase family protein [Desulfovermiculus halophilus]|jgi:aminomethyltransferase|uniref:aminomethyltransferase family protein n=1 Tax=Desulfovermiculus halophilus TaxID=339722 RepID=UPI000489B96B|nr:aminomethyltransferase family protein [Desulfovermiculus halophilus]
MSKHSKQTPLHAWHVQQGANMAPFGGYDMPVWYSSAKNEHLAVLNRAGLFDTSHMATVMVNGPRARDLLQQTFSRDLEACLGKKRTPLQPGRMVYGVFLTPKGHVIDDAIITHLEDDLYMVVVNAGMGPGIADHLQNHLADSQTRVLDLTDQVGKIDLQGPRAGVILFGLLQDPDRVFARMPYFSCHGHLQPEKSEVRLRDGTPLLLSRSGYTGEFGFEIFVRPQDLLSAWTSILEAGAEHGLLPCGLAARDSLRAGAVLPLSHQDIGDWPFVNTPWDFALPWTEDKQGFSKDFVGAQALRDLTDPPLTAAFVGKDLRKVNAGPDSKVLNAQGDPIGTVLSCVTDVGVGWHQGRIYSVSSPDAPEDFKPKGLSCGFVRVTAPLHPGDAVKIQDKRRTLEVTVAEDIRPDRTARKPLTQMLNTEHK